ncbi:MAG: hypothetical protein WCF22_13680 [Candidatus Sulfotelmatobacter sp.]
MAARLQLTELARVLHKHLTCPAPIRAQGNFGADAEFREVEQALETPGTTIFIHGQFGQGKIPHAHVIQGSYVCDRQGQSDFIVIDEFDEIATEAEQRRFASFVKQIAEQRTPTRFVLCGVSEPVREILGAHESLYDYVDAEEPRPTEAACGVAKVIKQPFETRVPHQVYVLSEKLFWEMFEDPTFARSLR